MIWMDGGDVWREADRTKRWRVFHSVGCHGVKRRLGDLPGRRSGDRDLRTVPISCGDKARIHLELAWLLAWQDHEFLFRETTYFLLIINIRQGLEETL